jgi:hypothetical protein
MHIHFKGQEISEANLDMFKSSKGKKNKKNPFISGLASKEWSNQKNEGTYLY